MNKHWQNLLRKASQLAHSVHLAKAAASIQRLWQGQRPTHPPPPTASPKPASADTDATTAARAKGDFISGTHTHQHITRSYKLYIPPGHAGQALPLVVMLHGCKQDPDDFAAGTGMNQRAAEQGFFVLFPQQPTDANPAACWNWFKANHQRRGSGEPALIASLAQAVTRQFGIDAERVYVAGLSAGGAMAAVLAVAYPEVFAAVGVHTGLAAGAASNVAQALMVMKTGRASFSLSDLGLGHGPSADAAAHAAITLPTIVFHGDADTTVHPSNGAQVVTAACGHAPSPPQVEHGTSAQGQRYTRSVWPAEADHAAVEFWLLHGAGHAWSGGRIEGSYTDPQGVDASAEMLRFFFSQRRTTSS
jgi:poly(hydroxyalkanoate) depolymerase family esterase